MLRACLHVDRAALLDRNALALDLEHATILEEDVDLVPIVRLCRSGSGATST